MDKWDAYFEEDKLRRVIKKGRNRRNIKYAVIAISSLIVVSLLGAMIGSPALAKFIFGSLLGLLAIAAAIANFVCFYWVIGIVFQSHQMEFEQLYT